MVALDSNIVTIALPEISKALSAGYSLLDWVLAGYLISLAALLLQSGKLGDIYGKKRIYLIGFAIFGAASALCGLSPDAYQLVAYRIIQGVGDSILFSYRSASCFCFVSSKGEGNGSGSPVRRGTRLERSLDQFWEERSPRLIGGSSSSSTYQYPPSPSQSVESEFRAHSICVRPSP